MLLVDGTHKRRRWWQHLVDKDEDRLLGGELDAFPDNIYELPDRQILRSQEVNTPCPDPLGARARTRTRTDGTKYFFLSMVGMSVLSAFSQIT